MELAPRRELLWALTILSLFVGTLHATGQLEIWTFETEVSNLVWDEKMDRTGIEAQAGGSGGTTGGSSEPSTGGSGGGGSGTGTGSSGSGGSSGGSGGLFSIGGLSFIGISFVGLGIGFAAFPTFTLSFFSSSYAWCASWAYGWAMFTQIMILAVAAAMLAWISSLIGILGGVLVGLAAVGGMVYAGAQMSTAGAASPSAPAEPTAQTNAELPASKPQRTKKVESKKKL